MALTKPSVLPPWADAGDKVQPTNAEIQTGWPLSNVPPSRQRFNWLLNWLMNGVRYITRRGMPDYGADETYLTGDRVIGDDGKTYRSLQDANTGHTPSTSPLWWERWGFTKAELTAELNNHDYKDSCRAATTVNLAALSGLLTVDGVALVAGDRVLVKNQTTGSQNGIYTAAAGAWSRATDFDANSEVTSALIVPVAEGTQSDSLWLLSNDGTITIGVTSLFFVQINGPVGTAGTYNSVTTDAQGRVVAGTNFARKNVLINGNMSIAQRATSAIAAAASYAQISLDRWGVYFPVGASLTLAQVAANGPGFRYAAKMQRNAGVTNVGPAQMRYVVETADSIPLQGKQVTLSFYAKAGANYSATSLNLQSSVFMGTGVDESNAGMGSWSGVTSASQLNALTTSWQRFTQTLTLPSNTSEIGLLFQSSFVGTAGADDSVYITGVQLEEGSVATNFEQRSIQQELALCQRYYETGVASWMVLYGASTTNGNTFGYYAHHILFKVKKRVAPTVTNTTPSANPYSVYVGKSADTDGVLFNNSGAYLSQTPTSQNAFSSIWTADAEL